MIFQPLQGSGLRNRHVTQQGWGPATMHATGW